MEFRVAITSSGVTEDSLDAFQDCLAADELCSMSLIELCGEEVRVVIWVEADSPLMAEAIAARIHVAACAENDLSPLITDIEAEEEASEEEEVGTLRSLPGVATREGYLAVDELARIDAMERMVLLIVRMLTAHGKQATEKHIYEELARKLVTVSDLISEEGGAGIKRVLRSLEDQGYIERGLVPVTISDNINIDRPVTGGERSLGSGE